MQDLSLAFQCGKIIINKIGCYTSESLDKLTQNSIDYLTQLFYRIKTTSTTKQIFLKKCTRIQFWYVSWRKNGDKKDLLGLLSRQRNLVELTIASKIEQFSGFIFDKPYKSLQKLVIISEQQVNAGILNALPNLRELKIDFPTKAITEIINSTIYHEHLESLEFCLTGIDAEHLCSLLKINKILKRIGFLNSNCEASLIEALACGLKDNASLKILEFHNISFLGNPTNLFHRLEHHASIEVMRVCYSRFYKANDVANTLGMNKLQEATLVSNSSAGKVQKLSLTSFTGNRTIKKLCLKGHAICPREAETFLKDLALNPVLTDLDLSQTMYETDKELLMQLAKTIRQNQNLDVLNLADNNLNELGAICLAQELSCCALIELNLSDNNMGSSGCLAILDSLKNNQRLQKLSLAMNNLSSDAIERMIELIRTMEELKDLDLSWNNLNHNARNLLREFSKERTINFGIDLSA